MRFISPNSLIALIMSLFVLGFSASSSAATQSNIELSIGEKSYFDTQTVVNNWYVRGNNRPLVASLVENDDVEQLNLNGGYIHPLQENWAVFVEAGVNSRYDDIATDRGFNLSTGVQYKPNQALSFVGSINSQQVNELEDSERALELRSSYRLGKALDVQASYAIEDSSVVESSAQQYFQVGLGFRF